MSAFPTLRFLTLIPFEEPVTLYPVEERYRLHGRKNVDLCKQLQKVETSSILARQFTTRLLTDMLEQWSHALDHPVMIFVNGENSF